MNLLDTASLVVTPNGYKASKLYSIVPSDGTGDMTFARTGDTATRVNSSGLIESVLANKPRLDYLGSTCPKLLLEPQRSNLFTYSEALDNASWNNTGAVTANTVISPDGTQNADTVTGLIYKFASITNAQSYTFSIFAKKNTGSSFTLRCDTTNILYCSFNLDTLAVDSGGKIESYNNGWYKCSFTVTANATGTGTFYIFPPTSIYLWGAQLEAGAYATSYIPTTTASVTRNVDAASKTSATALIGQTEGTLFWDGIVPPSYTEIFELKALSPLCIVRLRFVSGILYGQFYIDSTALNIQLSTSSYAIGQRVKMAFAYKTGNFVLYINGTQIAIDSSSYSSLTLDTIKLAADSVSLNKNNAAVLWKTRLQNSELVTLTTI
jgi:hypothetical protein